ncbi:MAG TPA: hypothetical protein PKO22_13220 [Treponemataceae bacterium]|nr:hypothetical protein [Treponemataceae bacterium]
MSSRLKTLTLFLALLTGVSFLSSCNGHAKAQTTIRFTRWARV